MASIKLYYDTRFESSDGTYPIKITLSHKNRTSHINLNIKVSKENFDTSRMRVISGRDAKSINSMIESRFFDAKRALREIRATIDLESLTATQIRDKVYNRMYDIVESTKKHLFSDVCEERVIGLSSKTRSLYMQMMHRLFEFSNSELCVEDIDKVFVNKFVSFILQLYPNFNTSSLYLIKFKAVVSYAIDMEYISSDPCRLMRLKRQSTKKRDLSVEELKSFLSDERVPILYRYVFKLVFCLIGINFIDLLHCDKMSHGRIIYRRRKTGRLYDIKVEPEALSIIKKYKGESHLLKFIEADINEPAFMMRFYRQYKAAGLTLYYARHSWATIAYNIGIDKDTISLALGHSIGSSVTSIYINPDLSRVDEANRRVIDFVFGSR